MELEVGRWLEAQTLLKARTVSLANFTPLPSAIWPLCVDSPALCCVLAASSTLAGPVMELEDGSRSWLKAKAVLGACVVLEQGVPVRAYGSVATSKVTRFWAALLGC